MGTTIPTCFISYTHEDVDKNILKYLTFILKQAMSGDVNIVFDADMAPGQNIQKFMNRSLDVDVALLILTPSYKTKVENRQGGCYEEFTKIMTRYWEVEQELPADDEQKTADRFQVIPILFSGTKKTSVPSTIENLLYIDLVGLTGATNKQGNFIVTDYIKSKFMPGIRRIVDLLLIMKTLKGSKYLKLKQEYRDELFVDTKASESKVKKIPNFVSEIFVRTISFDRAKDQSTYFLIGRKGSGKSTIATVLPVVAKQKYNGTIKIMANNINLNLAYSSLNSATLSDIERVIPGFSFFEYSWEGFLCLCLMGLLIDLEKSNKITTDQKSFMPPVRQYIESFVNKHETDNLQDAMFSFAIMKLQEFWNFCIKNARHSHGDSRFFSDISLAFNQKEYLAYLLGSDVISALSSVILNCKKRVLVTLDDFQ